MSGRPSRESSSTTTNAALQQQPRNRRSSSHSSYSSSSRLTDKKGQIEYVYALEDKQISEWLKCPICLNPFINPVLISTCEHVFCQVCIDQHIDTTAKQMSGEDNEDDDEGGQKTGQCPTCRAHFDTPQIKPAASLIRNIVDSLLVKCPNEKRGCMHLAERGLMGSHVKHECGFAYVDEVDFYRDKLTIGKNESKQTKDPIKRTGRCECGKKIMRKDWNDHIKLGNCSIERIACPFAEGEDGCGTLLKESDMDAHLDYCPARIVQCDACSDDFRQDEIELHRESCQEVQVDCPLHPYCLWQGKRGELGVETDGEIEGTLHLGTCKLVPLRSFLEQNSDKVDSLQHENNRLNQRLTKMEKQQSKILESLSHCIDVIGVDFAPSESQSHGQTHSRETGIIVPISSPQHRSGGPASPPLALRGRSGSAVDVARINSNAFYSDMQNRNRSSTSISHSIASAPLVTGVEGEPWRWPDESETEPVQEGADRLTSNSRQRNSNQSSIPQMTISNALQQINANLNSLTEQMANVERRLDDAHVVSMNAGFEAGRAHDELNSVRHGMHSIRLQMHSLLMQQQMGRNLGPSMGSANPTGPNGMYNPASLAVAAAAAAQQQPLSNPQSHNSVAQSPPPAGMMGLRRFWTGFEQTKL